MYEAKLYDWKLYEVKLYEFVVHEQSFYEMQLYDMILTGCTDTLINKEFANTLLKELPDVIIINHYASFQTISEGDEISPHHKYAHWYGFYHYDWDPIIGSTLNLLGFADDLQHPINSFFTYGDNHSYTSHSTTKVNDIDSSGKLNGLIEYPPPPSGHVVVDTVMTSPWLEITVRKKDDDGDTSPKWFHIDLSNQATSLAFQQQFRRVPELHWRMKMTTDEGKQQVQQKLDGFIDNNMMEIVDNDSRNIFASNIHAVRGRKRWRQVAPYLNVNTMLRSFMSAYKIADPQTRISQCLNRLQLCESCKLLDIQDAFMRVHIGCNLASMTMIMYEGRTYRFRRMLYG
ncbi:hypothetical protein FOZ60_016840 [Perkinsus olseni]|uniref:Uncharacterized protein n=1 Tax=Perkinsus olseni TaxID=32597 RepID=A0A7J6N327_PEROL|nr:hypothetical protein FOZ60_016840 [Perkinsus olseni]